MDESKIPQVVEVEKFVLGSMMLRDGQVVPQVTSILKADDFYRAEHRTIYDVMVRLYENKLPVNIFTVQEELRRMGKFDAIGGPRTVLALTEKAHTTAYSVHYAKMIKEKSLYRQLEKLGEKLIDKSERAMQSVTEILEEAGREIIDLNLANRDKNCDTEPVKPIIDRVFDKLMARMNEPEGVSGIPSGFAELDSVTNGFQNTDLIILAARPSMGKTAFAMNVAVNAAMKGHGVLVFSLEMGKEQLGQRLLVSQSGVNSMSVTNGTLDEFQFNAVVDAVMDIEQLPLYIDNNPGMTIFELRTKAQRLQSEVGINLIIVDYLQLLSCGGKSLENRQQEISEISRRLKGLASELNVPIIALSQLSRMPELRADKRPQLSDLRDSGALEQDADMVMFLYREEYYDRDNADAKLAELIIAKNRNGALKTINLWFSREIMKFETPSED